ncbi:MAG: zinc ribbon domain-containing protein [Thermoplasmata archaeon]|nr:zinc ribbon domain-containing protein [Thermoplasmata archaeon]
MTDGPSVLLVVFAVLSIVVVLLFGYYAIMRLRRRRRSLSLELENSRELVEDRAYNQIQLAQSAANALANRGIDVTRCRTLIADARLAQQRGDHDTALALARSAREAMAKMQDGTMTSLPPPRSAPGRGVGPSTIPALSTMAVMPHTGSTPSAVETDAPAPPARLPRNKLESHFQLTLLNEELERAAQDPASAGAVKEATALRDQAAAAATGGDYTESLRLALKARRRIGGRLETLPPPSAASNASNTPPSEETLVCTGCGEKLRPADRFCRYCGTLRGPARCPSCGVPSDLEDKFCAKCGVAISG